MQNNRYIALIPAFQPANLLVALVRELASGFSVVLVDDGSGKPSQTVFVQCAQYAAVLRHTTNAGKGRALKTGLSYILETFSPGSIIVTVDADGQHRPEDVVSVCRTAEQNPSALVLGSRRLKGNVPLRSRFGNAATRMVYRLSTRQSVHDTQTGLRAFSILLVPMLLSIPGERYEYEMNVLLHCACKKIKIVEQEIETVYLDHNSSSHFDTLRDSVRIYKEILKFSASSFLGFLVDYIVYSLLLLTGNLLFANIAARVVSASVNFALNRKFVFQKTRGVAKPAAQYFLLAAGILLGNTAMLSPLVNVWGVHQMIAKILTEILFFLFSWLVQRLFIFKKGGVQ